MSENNFGFIIHPIDPKRDVTRKYPLLGKVLTERQIDFFSAFFPPVYISDIDGIVSQATYQPLSGWFVACPLTPRRMLQLPPKAVYRKIIQTGRMAEQLGARILGLGAFTSVVGDAGITIARQLEIPVTTGDSYTIAIAIEAIHHAAHKMDIDMNNARAAVVGATGAIGSVCAQLLAEDVGELLLVGRRLDALEHVREQAEGKRARLRTSTAIADIAQADLILTVTNALEAIIEPQHLKPGAVVCDVARPRDVSRAVAEQRQDILVIEGGMVEVPGPVDFHFDFGFPQQMVYACMAETMALALEERYESFTLGKDISARQVREIAQIAARHGFKLGGLRSFEREVTPEHITRVREHAWAGTAIS